MSIVYNKAFEFIRFCYVIRITAIHPTLTWKNIKETPEGLALAAQSSAILMFLLVFSAAVGVALNVYK